VAQRFHANVKKYNLLVLAAAGRGAEVEVRDPGSALSPPPPALGADGWELCRVTRQQSVRAMGGRRTGIAERWYVTGSAIYSSPALARMARSMYPGSK